MTLENILENLNATIQGKTKYLEVLRRSKASTVDAKMINASVISMLELNITELERIREDVTKVLKG